MTEIFDRRDQPREEAIISRKRFLDRNKKHIKKAVEKAISDGNITDLGKGGARVSVPQDTLKEPVIHTGRSGVNTTVYPWNQTNKFKTGDIIEKPQGGGGGGGGKDGSPDGEGEDDFVFYITEEEFLNYLFDDLELPNMTKRNEEKIMETEPKSSGYTSSGPYPKMSLEKSFERKKARVGGKSKKYKEQTLSLLEEAVAIYSGYDDLYDEDDEKASKRFEPTAAKIKKLEKKLVSLKEEFSEAVKPKDAARLEAIDNELEEVRKKKKGATVWEDSDFRFRDSEEQPLPSSNAVMFCMMDVSGSMTEEKKSNAKVFYFLLYRFLKRHYENTDVVFIRYHSNAKEVDEKEFFYGRDTGGTVASYAMEKKLEIIRERYTGAGWNIYGAQASDGDNWMDDNPKTVELLKQIMDKSQAYFYMELPDENDNRDSDLWPSYQQLESEYKDQFFMGKVWERNDILKVFRDFFKKRSTAAPSAPGMRA